ncbi:MAG: NDP-sugar synthase [Candidatus Binatia bacterium]
MKALLLAAGEGLRLRPLTNDRPKAMVEVGGVPAVAHELAWLCREGVTEVAINLSHKPEVLMDFVGDGKRFGVAVRYSIESGILGTAGALGPLREFFTGSGVFLVLYGDVLTDLAMGPMLRLHQERSADLTMAVTRSTDPTSSGIVGFDANGRVERFVEKPKPGEVFSEWENAAVYLCSERVLDYVGRRVPLDFGHDVVPSMLQDGLKMCAYRSNATFCDIGSPDRLTRAETWLKGRNALGAKGLTS